MDNYEEAIKRCEKKLERIINKEVPLKNPPISIIHSPEKHIKEIYLQYVSMLKRLKSQHPSWDYKILNAEKILFDILRDLDYIDGCKDANTCDRNKLANDLRDSIKDDLIQKIQEGIQILTENNEVRSPPPFLVILNMHACYNYIQTKDLISSLHNLQTNILVLILYLERDRESKSQKCQNKISKK
jgi:hypothetical protein